MREATLGKTRIEDVKTRLEEIAKPFQQEQNKRQKKSDFIKKCLQSIDKNDFFQLDTLLKSSQAADILEDSNFEGSKSIFSHLGGHADKQIEQYQLQFRNDLLQLAEKAGLPIEMDGLQFSVLKGIEGKADFVNRITTINQTTIKSVDPRRIISSLLAMKRKLYDSPFDPQKFIDTLFECYKAILNKSDEGLGSSVSILPLYTDYVFALQSKTFFQNMDKGKFKGCSVEQFAIDIWRFFESKVSSTLGGYRIKLNPGRNKSLWLIDQNGEKRQFSHASFVKK